MVKTLLGKISRNKYWLLVGVVFSLILVTRLAFLGADLPSTHVEIEEKFGGYNARNMVFLGHWPLYSNWFQPMVWAPVQNFLSYLFFSFFGVGIVQFRLPMALASFFGLIFFFLILLKQTNRPLALFGLVLYAFSFEITVWNGSGLCENLYLLFMPLATYFLTTELPTSKKIFFFIFFAGLSVVAKLDGYSFFLAAAVFLFFWALKTYSFFKDTKSIVFGSLSALVILLALFVFSDTFKYLFSTYRFYFEIMVKQSSFLKGAIPSLSGFILLFLKIDPFIFLAFLLSLPVFIINRHRLNKTDWFMVTFLFFSLVTRLQIPANLIYWKRAIFLFFPFYYVVSKSLFLLWGQDEIASNKKDRNDKNVFSFIVASSFYSLAVIFLYLRFFSKSISRIYGFGEFQESYHYSKGPFFYLLFIVVLGIVGFNWAFFSDQSKRAIKTLTISILFFVLLSLSINIVNVGKMFIPGNIRYSYKENIKYTKMIPEEEMIISDEQGFRAFAYLSKHDFYFNHDGGPNPVPYREVFERKDLRYVILNVEEFYRERWGLSNKFRLQFIKQVYPNLKLIDVFFASRVPLAIYDKYGK